jgi:hypothetical protein
MENTIMNYRNISTPFILFALLFSISTFATHPHTEPTISEIKTNTVINPAAPMLMDITVCDGESTEIAPTAGMGGPGGTSNIYMETFDTDGEGVAGACDLMGNCATNVAPSNGQWSITGDLTGLSATSDFAITSGGSLEFQDTDAEVCFTSSLIDISGCTSTDFMVSISEAGTMEAADYVDVNLIIDGVSNPITNFMGMGDATHTLVDDFTSTTVTQNGIVGSTLVIEICVMNNAGSEQHFLDNIMVACTTAGSAITFKYYDVDPSLGGATPIAGPTTDPFDPMTAAGEMDVIWVTACEGTCESDATQVTVTVNEIPAAPLAASASYCNGDMILDVVPTGVASATFSYYSDAGLSVLLSSGASFTPAGTVGTETIFVTQTSNGCESEATEVVIVVSDTPVAPTADDLTFCIGDPITNVVPAGDAGAVFTYYSDMALSMMISSGSEYTPTGGPGVETIFITQTINNCESEATEVNITIAGIENVTAVPTCNASVLDYCLDISFDFAGPGPSNMYEVIVNGVVYGPFSYGMTGSEMINICDPINFIGDEQMNLTVEVADADRGNTTEGVSQTGGGASNLEGCIEIGSILPAQNSDNNGDGAVDFCDEFITLTNGGTGIIDISGYTISDAVAVRHIFPAGTIVNPSQTITLFNSDLNQVANCAGSGIWNNGGDDIILNDAEGGLSDMETYTGSTANVEITFEVEGCGMGTTTSTGPTACIQVNSVMANQTADNNGDGAIDFCDEFISITNPGNTDLDISGYMISDAATLRHIFPSPTILSAGQTLTIFNSDLSEVANCAGSGVWNNGGDDIIIADATGATLDEETYGSSNAGVESFFEIDECPTVMVDDTGICSGLTTFDEPNCCPILEVSSFMGMSICAGSCPAPGQGLMATTDCGGIGGSAETKWYSDPAGMFLVFEGDVFDPIGEGLLDNADPGKFTYYAQVSCDFCVSALVPVKVDIFDCDPPNDACGGCTYLVQLYDTAFNGWDGARFMVSVNEGPFVEYKPTASDCGFLSFPIDIIDGGTIDYMYMPGANAGEHAYKILDALGNTVATEGMAFTGNNIEQAVVTRIDAACPDCCDDATEEFTFVFTAGEDAFEKSWEIRDNKGVRVAFVNAGAYSGVFNGGSTSQSLFLDPCEEYTITTFSARNNGWEGGTYEFRSTNPERGTPISSGTFLVASGPADFSDELSTTFTLPCSLECPAEETILADDLTNCILNTYTAGMIEAPVCYPNNCHISPEPMMSVCYPTAIGGLVEGPLGTTSAALPVGSNPVVYKVTYSDGQIRRCTSQVHVISEINPALSCNDFVILPLVDDGDDCETVITADMILEDPDPCNAQYLITLTDPNGNDIGNVISLSNAGQTLAYTITQIGTGLSALCHGEILIEDKGAPSITCFDYTINCNHPEALNEFYSQTGTFDVSAAELPGNIAGGTASNPSELFLPIPDVGCGPFGEIIQDIDITINLTHNDIEDLTILLVAPDGTTITLLERRTCNNLSSQNISVTFDSEASTPVFAACNPGIPGLGGTFRPAQPLSILYNRQYSDLEGDWGIIVRDDDDTAFEGIGVGEVISASMELTTGFPLPYEASDCNLQSVTLINEIIVDTNCDQTGGLGANVLRIWQAEDAFGNISECTQTVGLISPNISDVDLPEDVDLVCGDVPSDPALLTTDFSGTPFFECFELDDTDQLNCDIIITFTDEFFDSCGDGYKLFRTWTIVNWCGGTAVDHVQTILVTDEIGPEITQSNITISTNEEACTASVDLDDLQVVDACSGVVAVTATFLSGSNLSIVDLFAGEVIDGLPLGTTSVTISATDGCGNTMDEDVNITVVDDVNPTAICDDELHISLSDAGEAFLSATDFDEGSNDNCSDVSLQIRSLGCEGNTFSDQAEFSCCDLGTVTVELLVTDAAGNTNLCWAEVLIEDAIAPTITCSEDLTITCDEALNAAELFDLPEAEDSCNTIISEGEVIEVDLPNCGKLLTKTFTVSDGSDKSDDASCQQTITVEHVSDFIVQFPADQEFTDCALADIAEPVVTEDDCENIGISVEDRIFTQVEDACYKIERTYTIINHCIVDDPTATGFSDLGTPLPVPNTFRDDDGYFQYTQIIKVIDSEAPSITFAAPDACDLTDACEGEAVLIATAEDACSDVAAVELSYEIDAFGDGTFDISGSGDDATGIYPYGNHVIRWIATDGCGNVTAEEFDFSVLDCKNPTPTCQGITTVVMNNGDCVAVSARDLLNYAEDNCTDRTLEEWKDNARIKFAGSNAALSTSIDICCADLFLGMIPAEIWIEDEAGNAEFCTVEIIIQDNMENCPDDGTGFANLIGSTLTETGKAVEEVNIEIDGTEMGQTNDQGAYELDLPMDQSYRVEPYKLDGVAEGISTFDLVLMAQHVLQINELTSPYQLLAADVNSNGSIDIFDMVELRQLILFQIQEFSNADSWIFIPKDYEFQNPASPFNEDIPLFIDVDIQQDVVAADFIAVKIGDLDRDLPPLTGSNDLDERRTPKSLIFEVEDQILQAGETVMLDFTAVDFNHILGYQFTLDFDPDRLSLGAVQSGQLEISEANFGQRFIDLGVLTSSYHKGESISLKDGAILFSIEITAHADMKISEVLGLHAAYTPAEAYGGYGDKLGLQLVFNSLADSEQSEFALYQNKPNPFHSQTIIEFNLPHHTDEAILTIYDLGGKVLYEVVQAFEAGRNQVLIDKSQLSQTGLLYYTLRSGQYMAEKKMIILE